MVGWDPILTDHLKATILESKKRVKVMDDLNELGDVGWQVTAMSESKTRVLIMLQREKAIS